MRLFNDAQVVQRGQLRLPFAMRAALGWHAGMRLYFWSHSAGDSSKIHNQLSLSTYLPRNKELWHLSGRFRDRPGMLTELTALLTTLNVDISTCRASTQLQNTEFAVDMEIETSDYESPFDLTAAQRQGQPGRTLRELYARIVSTFIKDVSFAPDGRPHLVLTRNRILSGGVTPDEVRTEVTLHQHGWLRIPKELLDNLHHRYCDTFPELCNAKGRAALPIVLVTADTRWGVCDLTFYFRDTGLRHVRIKCDDRIGALQKVTAALRDRDFNLLQLYSRVVPGKSYGFMDILVQSSREQIGDDRALMRFIRGALQSSALRELNVEVSFPEPQRPTAPEK